MRAYTHRPHSLVPSGRISYTRACAMFNFLEGYPRHPPSRERARYPVASPSSYLTADIRLIPRVGSTGYIPRGRSTNDGQERGSETPVSLCRRFFARPLLFHHSNVTPPRRMMSHIPHAPRASTNNY